jgi:hypothetical protein
LGAGVAEKKKKEEEEERRVKKKERLLREREKTKTDVLRMTGAASVTSCVVQKKKK